MKLKNMLIFLTKYSTINLQLLVILQVYSSYLLAFSFTINSKDLYPEILFNVQQHASPFKKSKLYCQYLEYYTSKEL